MESTKVCRLCWEYGKRVQKLRKKPTKKPVKSQPVIICRPCECESKYHIRRKAK